MCQKQKNQKIPNEYQNNKIIYLNFYGYHFETIHGRRYRNRGHAIQLFHKNLKQLEIKVSPING